LFCSLWFDNSTINFGISICRYEAQLEKDWQYILKDSDAKVLVAATEAIYEKCKDYPGKVSDLVLVFCNCLFVFAVCSPLLGGKAITFIIFLYAHGAL
jgi:hypothetical protein